MPTSCKTHEECRKTVCFLCMKKCDRELTEFMISRVQKILGQRLDFDDERLPKGVCTNCRVKLGKKDAGDTTVSVPALYNFNTIIINPLTRTSTLCGCLICHIGKSRPLTEKHPVS